MSPIIACAACLIFRGPSVECHVVVLAWFHFSNSVFVLYIEESAFSGDISFINSVKISIRFVCSSARMSSTDSIEYLF